MTVSEASGSARLLLLRRVVLLEATLVTHGIAVPEASAATRAACAIDAPDAEGCTALWRACEECDVEDARRLLGRGAGVDCATKTGCTPLHAACQDGHEAAARLLLQRGAAVDLAGKAGS